MAITLIQPSNGLVGPYSLLEFSSTMAFPIAYSVIVQVNDHVAGYSLAYTEFTFHFPYIAGQTVFMPVGGGVNFQAAPGDVTTFDWPEFVQPDNTPVDILIDISYPGGGSDQHVFTGNLWHSVGNMLGMFTALRQALVDLSGGAGVLAAVQHDYVNSP